MKVKEFVEALRDWTVLDRDWTVLDIVDALSLIEKEFGIKPISQVPLIQEVKVEEPEEEQREFTVHLVSSGDKKIEVIKTVWALTNLGLREAKELVDSVPQDVLIGVDKERANIAEGQLKAAGAVVLVK